MAFTTEYRDYIRTARKGQEFGFRLKTVAKLERPLAFLYQDWWKVDLTGQKHLPEQGPVLLVGNTGGILPWPGLMMLYALMADQKHPRRLNILADLDTIEDERLYNFLVELGFVSWSADNAKRLFNQGEIVAIFPEGLMGAIKPFRERYRVRSFDWTKFLPAIENKVPVLPLATLGPDESFPVTANLPGLARLLDMPAYPITPFFPWLPMPANLFSFPVKWKMRIMKPVDYSQGDSRDALEESAKKLALFVEGEVQAELNRLLRQRIRPLF